MKNNSFILVYHQIGEYQGGLHSLYTPRDFFDRQMGYLHRRGYSGISLGELIELIARREDISRKFVLTFDDGYENNFLNAYPVLKKYDFRATLFVHTGVVGGFSSYPRMPRAKMINWKQLSQIKDVFEIGSHTVNHPDLSSISSEEIKKELLDSKKVLEENLNVKVKYFCYPFGKVFAGYSEILKESGYEAAVSLEKGLVSWDTVDLYKLPRLEWKMLRHMSFRDFWENRYLYFKLFLGR